MNPFSIRSLRLLACWFACFVMQPPGAGASTAVAQHVWASLASFLHHDTAVHDILAPRFSTPSGPPRPPFFAATLAEARPAGNHGAFELIALVFDSLAAEPLHRVTRGPGASFLARPRCDALLSAAARGWDRIAQSVSLWDSAEPVDASAMGRTACKVERIEGQLRALATVSPSTPRAMCEDFNLAKDIEVNRLSLPSSPPSFDPSPFLDDTMRSLYLSPSRHAWPIDEAGEVPPRVQCRIGTKQEKLEFLSALDQSGRLELFPADQFDARTACGLFALPKGLDTDRLIVDARPSNLCVPTDVRWLATMASASSLLGIELDQDQRLFLSGEDIKDFYHQFRITVDRAAYYRIAGFFRPSDLSHLRSFKPSLLTSKRVVAALRCMAMGDCNAVSVGQSSHLGLILAAELVGWHQLLTMRGPVPRSPCMLGLVIDDAIVIEKALRCQTGDTASLSSQRLISGLHSAYLASKLPRHEKKSFFAAEDASFWGSDVLGELGRVRPAWARLIPLVSLTVSALNLPLFTVSLLEVLAGSWISVLAFRRRTLCLLEHIYLLQRGRCRTECVRATPELKAELFRLCVLAPLLHTDLRAQTSGLLLASDASDSLGAFVTTRVTKVFSRELQRHTPARGLWNKLLSPVNALLRQKGYLDPNLELPGEVFRTHPLWTTLVRSLPFKLRAVFRRRKRDHINIKEMDSYIAAEESLAPFDWESARTLALVDSQVILGALLKGRSSSPAINSRLRASLPGLLFFNLFPNYTYIGSEDNPSDDPTRGRRVRQPQLAEPSWLVEAELGRFAQLDRFLWDYGLDPLQTQGLVDLQRAFSERRGTPGVEEDVPSVGDLPTLVSSEPLECLDFGTLSSAAAAFLQGCPRRQFLWPSGLQPSLRTRFLSPGYLCLYAGSRTVAKETVKAGFPWAITFDWLHGANQDLLCPKLQAALLAAISAGAFAAVGLSPSCPTFSTAVTPPVRSAEWPAGVPDLSPHNSARVACDNAHASFVGRVVKLLVEFRVPFWVEGPERSWLWKQPDLLALVTGSSDLGFWTFDHCSFGRPWQKRTRVLTSTELRCKTDLCTGGHEHKSLRGRVSKGSLSWTKLAETPPSQVAVALAMALAAAASDCRSVSSCVRDTSKRIGEASRPGPPQLKQPRTGSLFDVELVTKATAATRTRVWDAFVQWLRERISESAVMALFTCPPLLALVLRDYADELYRTGVSLGNYRQLLAHAQRRLPLLRPHMKPAWEMVTRWQELQPVTHRTPLPEMVLKAMVGIAWMLKWRRWAAVTLAIFYAINRPGELLSARRSQVLTPLDLLEPDHGWMYFCIKKPKSRRKAARVQHSKLCQPGVLQFLTRFFEGLRPHELLYPGSPGVYRRRWDKILGILGLTAELRLTPGSLRAGGAICAFQHGATVSDLLWRMRLRSQSTLEFYLQEMSAVSILPNLSPAVRRRILTAAAVCQSVLQ